MKSKRLSLCLSLVALLGLVGCGENKESTGGTTAGGTTEKPAETVDTSEKELNLLAGCEEPYMNAVADAFAKKYNVKVNRVRKSSGEIENQVKNEKGNPSADVIFGGTTDPYNALKNEGLLMKYKSANDDKISDLTSRMPTIIGMASTRESWDSCGTRISSLS